MEYAKLLLDKAGEACGSFYKLHKHTGFKQSHISEARAGKRPVPLEWVPVLAEICGEDAKEALAMCMAERLPEGSRARAILGEVRAVTVAVMLLFFVVLGPLLPSNAYAASTNKAYKLKTLYIVEYRKRVWQACVDWLFRARVIDPLRRSPRPRQAPRTTTPRRGLGAVFAIGQ